MQTPDLTELNASVQAIIRRAYEQGRSDALKKVVGVLSEDRPESEHLALTGPQAPNGSTERAEANGSDPGTQGKTPAPWWSWRVK